MKNKLFHILFFTLTTTINLSYGSGDLDTSFGGDGTITKQIDDSSIACAVAIQNEKIIIGGNSQKGKDPSAAITAYLKDGQQDLRFGTCGTAKISIGQSTQAHAMALLPNGKIIIAGSTVNQVMTTRSNDHDHTSLFISQLTDTGFLDISFNSQGYTTQTIGLSCSAQAMALQPDGKILVAGKTTISEPIPTLRRPTVSRDHFFVTRYNANGTQDRSFSSSRTNYITTTLIGDTAQAHGMALAPDGKILLVGQTLQDDVSKIALTRYTRDGLLDHSFGTDGSGIVITQLGTSSHAHDPIILPSGKILVACEVIQNNIRQFALLCYTSQGILDNSFGPKKNGVVITQIGLEACGEKIAVQDDGLILIAGHARNNLDLWQFAIARYTQNGYPDQTFGTHGQRMIPIGDQACAHALAIQPDNNIVIAGETFSPTKSFAVARILSCSSPTANPINISMTPNSTASITLSGSSPNLHHSGNLNFSIRSGPSNGTISGITQTGRYTASISYTPNTRFENFDAISYSVFDGIKNSPEAPLNIAVANHTTYLTPVHLSTVKNKPVIVTFKNINNTKVDYEHISYPMHGMVSGFKKQSGSIATIVYTPNKDFIGTDTFFFVGTELGKWIRQTATINVLDRTPQAHGQTVHLTTNTPKQITLTGSPPNTYPLHFTITKHPKQGTLSAITQKTNNSASVTYTPKNGIKNDSFAFKVTDDTIFSAESNIILKTRTLHHTKKKRPKFPQGPFKHKLPEVIKAKYFGST